jgi:hypothetical protein
MAVLNSFTSRRSLLRTVVEWMLVACLVLFAPCALRAESREYQIKAAFLYNFAQFVVWPEKTFANTNEPFRIGVLGDNPFGKSLEEIVHGETIQGHPIEIVQSPSVEKLAGVQILFVNKSQVAHFGDVSYKLDSKPVLTVGEDAGFIQHGGMINFYRDGTKVRFEINPEAAEKKGLKLGSELLSLGKIVHSEQVSK